MQRFNHTPSRRRFLALAGSAGAMTLLAACTSTPTAPPAAQNTNAGQTPAPAGQAAPVGGAAPAVTKPATIQVLTFVDAVSGSDARGLALQQINANFLQKYPNVTVKFQIVPFEQLGPKYMTAFAAGNAPDVTFVRDDYFLRINDQGGLADLNQWMKDWPKSELADFYNAAGFGRGVVGDKRYLMYTFGSVSGLHYRKELFQQAKVDPAAIKTWDDWAAALTKVCVDKSGKHPDQAGFDPNNVAVWGFTEARLVTKNDFDSELEAAMLGLGQTLLTPDAKANWNNDAGIRSMTMWTDLIVKHNVEPIDDITREREGSDQLFQQGLSASTWIANQRYKDFLDKSSWNAKDNLAFMAWPSFDGQKPSPVGVGAWTMGISSKSQNMDAAWAWLNHYLSAESDAIMARVGGVLPSRLSTLNDPAFNTPDFAYFKQYLDVAAKGSFEPSRAIAKVTPATENGTAFQDIVVNHMPVAQAIQGSADRFDKAEAAA
jgi:multiple sugar transport system substrate-binding protein